MAVASAVSRFAHEENSVADSARLDAAQASAMVSSWMNVEQADEALSAMGTGIVSWRAVPAAQKAIASILSDRLEPGDSVMCVGARAHVWMRAAGVPLGEVLGIHLGKSLVNGVYAATTQDVIDSLSQRGSSVHVVALHAESDADWNDVRAISSAAVKAEKPLLLLVSAACAAPRGAAVEVISEWTRAAVEMRAALDLVRGQGAIRVLALADMESASIERAMMEAAGITPARWDETMAERFSAAQCALNAAFQAPLKSL